MTQVQNALTYRAVATFGAARAGFLHTLRGEYQTPMFMPVGTFGALRGILPDEARQLGFDIILGNYFSFVVATGGAMPICAALHNTENGISISTMRQPTTQSPICN